VVSRVIRKAARFSYLGGSAGAGDGAGVGMSLDASAAGAVASGVGVAGAAVASGAGAPAGAGAGAAALSSEVHPTRAAARTRLESVLPVLKLNFTDNLLRWIDTRGAMVVRRWRDPDVNDSQARPSTRTTPVTHPSPRVIRMALYPCRPRAATGNAERCRSAVARVLVVSSQ
jgi:hypothetical protein